MDGKRCIGGVANFQIEIKADEIVEFKVGIVVLVARLAHNGDLDPIPYRGAGAFVDRGVSTRGHKYQGE
jgi:hypothetical protein